mgnify:CR=1 FL=1
MEKSGIAVFGGSFNPPTIAHISLAKQVLAKMDNLEKVILVPVSTRYNKNGLASDEIRFNMLEQICAKEPGLEVSRLELDSDKQLYTIETLRKIKQQNPNKQIYFVLGTDNLKELETWHKVYELLSSFKFIVLKRDEDSVSDIIDKSTILKKYESSFFELNGIDTVDLSSSYVRKRIQDGETIVGLVPSKIEKMALEVYKK